jgi:multiple sugar transport system substrate-binding protein
MNRKWGFAVGLVAIPLLLAGCGSSSSSSSSKDSKNEVKVTWRYQGSKDPLSKYLKNSFLPEFKKENPDIKVVLAPITASEGDYFSKVDLAMKSESTAPDIVAEDSFMLNADASAGYLTQMDKYVKNWDQWSNYTENLKAGSMAEDGKLYAIPGTSDSRGLWYNKDVFKKAGLPVNWQPKTWDDIIKAGEKIKAADSSIIPIGMGVAKANGESVAMQTYEMFSYGTENPIYNTETKKWNVGTAGNLDCLKFIDEVYNQKKLGPSLSIAINSNYGSVTQQEKFPDGKLGIMLEGYWASGSWAKGGAAPVENMTEHFGFAAMPTQNGQGDGTTTMSGGWTWAIPAKSSNKANSWKVIKALGSKEQQALRAKNEGNLTVRNDSAQVKEYKDQDFIETATGFLKHAHFRPANEKYPKVSVEIQSAVEAVATNSKTPQQALNDYAANVTRIVGKNNITK